MFLPVLLQWVLVVSAAWAAPPYIASGCNVLQAGNLSPNGVSGNFGLYNGALGFDPTNLATGFDVTLLSCPSSLIVAGASGTGTLSAPTGQCLAANATATQGWTVFVVDCSTTNARYATWALYDGFIFWAGPTSFSCSTGLYGYVAESSSGCPAAVQKVPITLGCLTDSRVFGFSVLY